MLNEMSKKISILNFTSDLTSSGEIILLLIWNYINITEERCSQISGLWKQINFPNINIAGP